MYETITYSRPRHRSTRHSTLRNHNLEQQAQALYKSWFVDFEPFKDGKFVESELGMKSRTTIRDLQHCWRRYAFKGYTFVLHNKRHSVADAKGFIIKVLQIYV